MFKKIQPLILACALAPAAVPALAEYEEICLHNNGGYVAGFHIEIVKRGVSPGGPGNISHRHYVGDILSPNTKCASLGDAGVRAGDGIRVLLDPIGDINNSGNRYCGPFKNRARGNEGFFLIPDGRPSGRLTFKSWGGLYHAGCELEGDDERMHSACGATLNGMDNGGCNAFELDQAAALGKSGVSQVPDAIERGAAIGQLFDLIDRARRDVNQAQADGSTGLHQAALHVKMEHMNLLIRRGADMDRRNNAGSTPLMSALLRAKGNRASEGRRFEIVTRLLEAGADPNLGRDDGDFPLHHAARHYDAGIVQKLLDAGAEVNALHPVTGESPLRAAQGRGDGGRDAVVAVLRAGGAEQRVYQEEIPNLIATDAGADLLQRALTRDNPADPDEATEAGLTGLHVAAVMNRPDYADILLEEGASPDARDEQGRTPLMAAIEADPGYPAVVQSLLWGGANPNIPRNDDKFPLYLAVEGGRDDIVDMILYFAAEGSVDVNQRHPGTGKTALGLAEQLLESGGRPEHRSIQLRLLNYQGER